MVKIDIDQAIAVAFVMRKLDPRNGKSIEQTFRGLGISKRQWKHYLQTGVLKVRPAVKARFELIARFQPEGSDMSLLPVLLKVLEARGGS